MDRINSILWVQHEDASRNGYLVVNGTIVSNPNEGTYHLVNRKLLRNYPLSIFDESMVKKYMNNSANQYFQLGSGLFKGIAYRSCFLEKDENGDNEPFLFWQSSLLLKGFINDALTATSALGKTLDRNELKFVDKYVKKVRTRRIIFCAIVSAIVILTILLSTIKTQ